MTLTPSLFTQDLDDATSSSRQSAANLRVGFISFTDPAQTDRMASMPYRMAATLGRRVGELITFSPEGGTGLVRQPKPWSSRPVIGRAVRHLQWRFLTFDGSVRALEHYYPRHTRRRTLKKAHRLSRWIADEVSRHELDVLFGCIVTWPLFRLPIDLPYVFYTDATTTIVNATYPRFDDRTWGFKQACTEIENEVYAGASAVAVPADRILESALADHHLDVQRGHVVPMGANVLPQQPLASVDGLDVPERDALRLCIVASDPKRKRTDFAVAVAELLAARGWGVRLTVIGPSTPRALQSPVVECMGPSNLSDPESLARHQQVLADSHLMILPSLGEGAAIAPAEAAHFGRPSIVSDVAGLPTVVKHQQTGVVMPLGATPVDYADALESMIADTDRYRAMSEAALHRAQNVLSWEAWGDRIAELLVQAAQSKVNRRAGN